MEPYGALDLDRIRRAENRHGADRRQVFSPVRYMQMVGSVLRVNLDMLSL